MDGPRRSSRKKEEKSYAESPDFIIEEALLAASKQDKSLLLKDTSGHVGHLPTHNVTALSNGDVEMESEDEDDGAELPPLPLPKELPPDVQCEKEAQIRKLQQQLRNEEMALVLLKKIRQSQLLAEHVSVAKQSPLATNNHISNQNSKHYVSQQSHSRGTVFNSRETVAPSHNHNQKSQGGKHVNASAAARVTSSPRDRDQYARQLAAAQQQIQSGKSSTADLLKQVNLDPKNLPPGLPANLVNLIGKGSLAAVPTNKLPEQKSKPPPKVEETPQQKQAAAKLALRQQLEKTLLQIPPPKPPPPEMHFIPNPANSEFIYLLGLEECVRKILNEDKDPGVQPLPFTCSQCNTDFTPTWKWDKGAKGQEVKVICENCVTTNVKKALKAEHTNRLKAAFVKALQQEQELEAHMAAQAASSSTNSTAAAAARVASPDTTRSRLPASLDVSVRTAPARSSIPSAASASAHQQQQQQHRSNHVSASNSNSYTSAATVERTHHRISSSRVTNNGGSVSRGSRANSNHSSSTNDAMARLAAAQALLPSSSGTNGNVMNHDLLRGSSSSLSSSRSNKEREAQAARDSASAMAAAASLMGAGGYDLASMVALQQLQQQMLLGSLGTGGGSTSTSNSSSRNTTSGSGSSGSASGSAALNSQLAALSQQMMNPLYNYQAMAMAQAMAAGLGGNGSGSGSSGGGGSGGTNASGSGSKSAQSATNQMIEIQRQAAEQLQRQYLLEMIPPGSLSSPGAWGKK